MNCARQSTSCPWWLVLRELRDIALAGIVIFVKPLLIAVPLIVLVAAGCSSTPSETTKRINDANYDYCASATETVNTLQPAISSYVKNASTTEELAQSLTTAQESLTKYLDLVTDNSVAMAGDELATSLGQLKVQLLGGTEASINKAAGKAGTAMTELATACKPVVNK